MFMIQIHRTILCCLMTNKQNLITVQSQYIWSCVIQSQKINKTGQPLHRKFRLAVDLHPCIFGPTLKGISDVMVNP